jgi:hypothetical protein
VWLLRFGALRRAQGFGFVYDLSMKVAFLETINEPVIFALLSCG